MSGARFVRLDRSVTASRTSDVPAAEPVLAKARHENFPVALRVLPRTLRRRLEAIYGFARLVDDIGDELPGDREAALDWLEDDLRRAFRGEAEHPLLQRVTVLARETGVGDEPFRRLIEANRIDQRKTAYATWDELAEYCVYSANPVGELVLASLGAATPERVRLSDDVCTALQLAEHLQDVPEDLDRGRVYIPQEDLKRFDADPSARVATPEWRALMAFEIRRTREYYASADTGLPMLPPSSARSIRAARRLSAEILDRNERAGGDVFSARPRVPTARKALVVGWSVVRPGVD